MREASVLTPFVNDGCVEAVDKWLATQRIEDLDRQCEKYIYRFFPTADSEGNTSEWVSLVEIAQFREKSMKHKLYDFLSQLS